MIKQYIFFCLAFLAIRNPIQPQTYNTRNEPFQIKDTLQIIDFIDSNDTLKIVSPSDFLYYPLGRFNNIYQFKKRNSSYGQQIQFLYPFNDSTQQPEMVYKMTFDNSFVEFYVNSDNNRLEILSGEISNEQLKLLDGLKIGINKKEFAYIISNSFYQYKIEKTQANVIELESVNTGIWHFYIFRNDTLKVIYFNTDVHLGK